MWGNNVDTCGQRHDKSAVLYDAGGWFVLHALAGVFFWGIVVDYFWNYLIVSLALRLQRIAITGKRRFVYTGIITAIGLLIDWLYCVFTWGILTIGGLSVPAIFEEAGLNPGLELSTIVIPIVLIGVVNYLTSRLYLRLDSKRALVFGSMTGILTAPWVIAVLVVFFSW